MSENEVFKHSQWLSLPVPDGTESGDPVLINELCGVAQTKEGPNRGTTMVYTPTTFGNVPDSTGFNEEGYASVALNGAFAFDITDGDTLDVGDPVYIVASTRTLQIGTSGADAKFGHVVNWLSDGRTVVRIMNPAGST